MALPSAEICSSVCFILVDPIHQVMVAGGLDPAEVHVSVDTLSATNVLDGSAMRTLVGLTVKLEEKHFSL